LRLCRRTWNRWRWSSGEKIMTDKPLSPIRVVVVDDDPEAMALVLVRLKDHPRITVVGTGTNGREAIKLANTLNPDVMVLDVLMPILNGLEAAARISHVFPSIGLLILTSETSPESIRAALRAGAKDYLDKSTELSRLADGIIEADAKRDRAARCRGLAPVWAFYSAKGSVGATTLAVATAHELASQGNRVVLVDLDLLHGDCAFYLDMPASTENLFSRIEEQENLQMRDLTTFLHKYTTQTGVSFDLLESPSDCIRIGDKGEQSLVALMDLLITSYDHVIIDLPAGRIFESHNMAVVDFVDRLFFIASRDMSSLKGLLVFCRVLGHTTMAKGKLSILVSPLREQADFDHADWLQHTNLKGSSFMEVPPDRDSCGKALAKGLPVPAVNPDSGLSRFVRTLVEVSLNRTPSATGSGATDEASNASIWKTFKSMFGG